MCDAFSFASALGDIGSGIAGSIDAKSRGQFEAAQHRAMKMLGTADARHEENALRRAFDEQTSQNVAAAAISGLAQHSFDSIEDGNRKDLRRNIKMIDRRNRVRGVQIDAKAAIAQIDAKMEARASIFAGINAAAQTLYKADRSYRENHLIDETRWSYFRRSLGVG